jgi:hypothetical protein
MAIEEAATAAVNLDGGNVGREDAGADRALPGAGDMALRSRSSTKNGCTRHEGGHLSATVNACSSREHRDAKRRVRRFG